MKVIAALLLIILPLLSGCDQLQNGQSQKSVPKPIKTTYPIHRFERPAGVPDSTALDTLTGQYCRTWDWHFKNPKAVGSSDIQDLPQCVTLLYLYPSEVITNPPAPDNKAGSK